jgi:hypothetical protein
MILLGYVALLLLGTAMFVFGLLQATHAPFQRWWYGTEWSNPKHEALAGINSDEYKVVVANMRMAGARAAGCGFLLAMLALFLLSFSSGYSASSRSVLDMCGGAVPVIVENCFGVYWDY